MKRNRKSSYRSKSNLKQFTIRQIENKYRIMFLNIITIQLNRSLNTL